MKESIEKNFPTSTREKMTSIHFQPFQFFLLLISDHRINYQYQNSSRPSRQRTLKIDLFMELKKIKICNFRLFRITQNVSCESFKAVYWYKWKRRGTIILSEFNCIGKISTFYKNNTFFSLVSPHSSIIFSLETC